jgi:hypothetical protein
MRSCNIANLVGVKASIRAVTSYETMTGPYQQSAVNFEFNIV